MTASPLGDHYAWTATAVLPAPRPSLLGSDAAAGSTLDRPRGAAEPKLEELISFADSALRGTKVELRSGERSTFAQHLTMYLAGWGMDVTHVSLDPEPDSVPTAMSPNGENLWNQGRREMMGKYDGGGSQQGAGSSTSEATSPNPDRPSPVTSSTSTRHSRVTSADYHPPSASSSVAGDTIHPTNANFIVIDDDVVTLRRLLLSHRTPPALHYAPTLLKQRPQLATRRTRSSTHVRQAAIVPPVVIIHFASLTHYRQIKEIVQDALSMSRSTTLPEVLVIPKPAGPRRIITALWTALRRPNIDPLLPPIATCPASPGTQYWTPRLSPSIAHQQDFDSAAAEALSAHSDAGTPGSQPRARTPPCYFPGAPAGHPPSPLGKISDEQVSYFSCVAETMDGTSPSEGMVVQSPNGRPAIFFQPQPRGSRTTSLKKDSKGDEGGHESAGVSQQSGGTPPTTPPIHRSSISAPHEIGLGHSRRMSSATSTAADILSAATPALSLDMYISAAKTRAVSDSANADLKSPVSSPAASLHRTGSASSSASRPSLPSNPVARPALVPHYTNRSRGSTGAGLTVTPARVDSPSFASHSGRASPMTNVPVRRYSGQSSNVGGRARRNTIRRSPTISAVPPINVLIVEGTAQVLLLPNSHNPTDAAVFPSR